MTLCVSVIGPGDGATPRDLELAREVGRLLAEHSVVVVTGGRGGVMEAASAGARQGGGFALGFLPGDDRAEANSYLSVAVPTGLGELRNGLVVRTGDAIVAVGGGWGTLNEISLAMKLNKPVLCLGGWRVQDSSGSPIALPTAGTPVEAVTWALAALAGRSGPAG